ncbi:MAG: hypothetical protein M0T75_10370 [Chloroflexi bacterium]|nr:hypothetical protein [Chloroflexota bacterium]
MSPGPTAFGPLVRLATRGLLNRRRSLGVVVLAAAPPFVAAILAFSGRLGDERAVALDIFTALVLALVVPLVGLVLGTAVLGAAIDDGTIVYVLVKPVPRRVPVLAAMLVAAVATAALAVPSAVLTGFLVLGGTAPGLLAGMALGSLLAAVLYAVVFVTLSVFTGRALLVGLGYVLVWEGLATTILAGTRILSVREYALAVVGALGGPGTVAAGGVDVRAALLLAAAALGGAVLLGAWRLARFEVSEAG